MKIIIGVFLILTVPFFTLKIPIFMRIIIDDAIPNSNVNLLISNIVLIILFFIISKFITYFEEIIFYTVNSSIVRDIRATMFKKIMESSNFETNKHDKGDLITRVEEDIKSIAILLVDNIARLIKDVVTLVISIWMMVKISKLLGSIVILTMFFYSIITYIFNKKIENYSIEYIDSVSKSKGVLIEFIKKIEFIKINSMSKFSISKYSETLDRKRDSNIKLGIVRITGKNILSNIVEILPYVILGIGGLISINNSFSVGSIVAFTAYMRNSISPLNGITQYNFNWSQAKISFSRMNEIFNFEEKKIKLEKNPHSLSLEKINYSSKEKVILKDININIKKGEKVVAIGHSGAGKSTLINIIIGKIQLNEQFKNNDFEFIGQYLESDPYIYNGNLEENIALEEIVDKLKLTKALETAKLEDKILNLSNDLINWSHGEKQKVSLARALYQNKGILVIDEGLSNIDRMDLNKIIDSLINNNKLTMIYITHNLEIIEKFDRVIKLEKGKEVI